LRLVELDQQNDGDGDLRQLVGNGVEDFAERAYLIEFAGDFAVKKIGDARKGENRDGEDFVAVQKEICEEGHKDNSDNRKQVGNCHAPVKQILYEMFFFFHNYTSE
jgi:hypothetical protein